MTIVRPASPAYTKARKIGEGLDVARWRWRARLSFIGLLALIVLVFVVPAVVIQLVWS